MKEIIGVIAYISLSIALLVLAHSADESNKRIKALEEMNYIMPMRDYQLALHMDTVWVYDGERLVGKYTTQWNCPIDSIIKKDNPGPYILEQ